jgi:hypothetical protein
MAGTTSVTRSAGNVKMSTSVAHSGLSDNPFIFKGQKSSILSEASLNILTRGLPGHLFGAVCSVRYDMLVYLSCCLVCWSSLVLSVQHHPFTATGADDDDTRFSVATGGGSLLSLLHAAEVTPYRACMLVIKDSIG